MDLDPGNVVILKSGGRLMTVAEVKKDTAICVWMGEEGDLFREALPIDVLDLAELEHHEDDEEEEAGDDEADDDSAPKVA
jgi:uncharacterized protein YodC (DUF2158 family)